MSVTRTMLRRPARTRTITIHVFNAKDMTAFHVTADGQRRLVQYLLAKNNCDAA